MKRNYAVEVTLSGSRESVLNACDKMYKHQILIPDEDNSAVADLEPNIHQVFRGVLTLRSETIQDIHAELCRSFAGVDVKSKWKELEGDWWSVACS